MKNKISFLAILAVALGVSYAHASECVDDDCELNPIVIEEETETPETVDIPEPEVIEINDESTEPEIVEDVTVIKVLNPQQDNESVATAQIQTEQKCEYDFNCPFETIKECDIWYTKPVYKESLDPREPHINPIKIDDIIYAISIKSNTYANDPVFEPLVERYKMLMHASKACCNEGILYKMRAQKASEKQIYQFLKDDANYFAVGSRCLVMDNNDITDKYSNGVDGKMVTDVRNACLCKNRDWFNTLLNPFVDVYNRVPEFVNSAFEYTYIDGLNRNITVSINKDVQNTLDMLMTCPK